MPPPPHSVSVTVWVWVQGIRGGRSQNLVIYGLPLEIFKSMLSSVTRCLSLVSS